MTQRATAEPRMRVQAEPTDIMLDLDGVEVRVWNAITDTGDQVFLFVHRVSSRADLEQLIPITVPLQMRRVV